MINKKMMGTMAVLGMMLAGGTIANAQTKVNAAPTNGTTPVTYDNRTVLPDGNAQYGMVIPTAISFTDDKQEADASVEIIGINGYNLDDWKDLDVTTKVQSKNGYLLKNDDDSAQVSYKIKMDGNATDFTADKNEQDITNHFGIKATPDPNRVKKVNGKAELTGKAVLKGQYADELTYKFTEHTNTLK